MYGWRARIGYISPSVMELVPYYFYKLVPDGVGLVGVTCDIADWRKDQFDQALGEVYARAESLGRRGVDYVVHGGVPLVASRGAGFDLELIAQMRERSGRPSTTGVRSAIAAFEALGTERVGVVAPYPAEILESVGAFLEGSGCKTVDVPAMQSATFHGLQWVTAREIYGHARTVVARAPAVEVLYMPCPQWPALDVVNDIERDFGRPVVTSLQADIWRACSELDITGDMRGKGRLLGLLQGN